MIFGFPAQNVHVGYWRNLARGVDSSHVRFRGTTGAGTMTDIGRIVAIRNVDKEGKVTEGSRA